MRARNLALAALATATLHAPAAQAGDAWFHCEWVGGQHDDLTGQPYQGVVVGFVVSPSGGSVAIDCVVTVNGMDVSGSSAPPQQVFVRDVSFSASDSDDVQLCADVTDHGVTVREYCEPI